MKVNENKNYPNLGKILVNKEEKNGRKLQARLANQPGQKDNSLMTGRGCLAYGTSNYRNPPRKFPRFPFTEPIK